ncbi:hypothetical protein [Streptomyces griseocarneus]|uniref:hypothetical protein n=1 Tax=Streptomyces griseocarneus TaxID=51201 RepID=UPI00167D658E|nr:hypothetical protein [Streptomyces griseocarneus]MBZ6475376.1 hypothetical protein [Streptomyces griseocarneus]GHG74932.1 hypothetical protein GCM10018779_52040 [Streptomyces griseocarneus]
MNRLRTHALAAAPIALLIGLAAPAAAAGDPQPIAPKAPRAVCDTPAANAILTVQEGIALRKCSDVKIAVKTWHWMGNYGSVYDVVNAANGGGIGAGEVITQYLNGLYPTFMFY